MSYKNKWFLDDSLICISGGKKCFVFFDSSTCRSKQAEVYPLLYETESYHVQQASDYGKKSSVKGHRGKVASEPPEASWLPSSEVFRASLAVHLPPPLFPSHFPAFGTVITD